MAQPSAYEYLKHLMAERGQSLIDATILAVNGALVDVRIAGSSRVLRSVPLAEHVYTDRLIAGAAVSLGLHQTQPFVAAIHMPPSSDDPSYTLTASSSASIPRPSLLVALEGSTYKLTWTCKDASKYRFEVFANDDDSGNNPTQIGFTYYGVTTHEYTGSLNWFAVRAVQRDGKRGPLSAWVTVLNPFKDLPLAPSIEVEYLSAYVVEITIVQNASGGAIPDRWAVYKATDGEGTGSTLVGTVTPDASGTTIYLPTVSNRATYTWYRVAGQVADWSGDPSTYLTGAYCSWEQDDHCPTPDEDPVPYTLTPEGWEISWDYIVSGTDYEDHIEFVDVYTYYAGGE